MTRSLPMLDEVLSQPATDSDEAGFGALIDRSGLSAAHGHGCLGADRRPAGSGDGPPDVRQRHR